MSPIECRQRAVQCLEMSETAGELTRELLLTMATIWLRVAADVERAGRLFAEDLAA